MRNGKLCPQHAQRFAKVSTAPLRLPQSDVDVMEAAARAIKTFAWQGVAPLQATVSYHDLTEKSIEAHPGSSSSQVGLQELFEQLPRHSGNLQGAGKDEQLLHAIAPAETKSHASRP